MSRICRYTFLFLIVGFLSLPCFAAKRAYLIGVSDYQDSNWCHLSSDNDLRLISESLAGDWIITEIRNEKATHQGILDGLRVFRMLLSVGDTVLVHFSGHGQQMIQDEDDESEPDFLDEAIVPYDAYMHYSEHYKGECHIRDNDLSSVIDQMRNVLGPRGLVVVTIDACHSDSMQRGKNRPFLVFRDNNTYRGTSEIFGETISDEILRKRFMRDKRPIEVNNNANVVYISACQAHSRNQEIKLKDGRQYGSLSYAVAQSIQSLNAFNASELIELVLSNMKEFVPYQKPSVRKSF